MFGKFKCLYLYKLKYQHEKKEEEKDSIIL